MIFEFYPTIVERGMYFWRNEAALNILSGEISFLEGRLSLNFGNIIHYKSGPAPGFKRRDIPWIGVLQFSF
jgi:hypothetical protein